LREVFADVQRGAGGVVLISGEPGIGKSRLADELERIAAHRESPTLWGHCFETDAAPAYLPWTEIAPQALALDHADAPGVGGAHLRELARLMPELVSAEGQAVRRDDEQAGAQWRLFEAFVAVLVTASSTHPVVVVLEDVQWADNSSLKLLEHVAAR